MNRVCPTWLRVGCLGLAALVLVGCSRRLTLPTPHPIKGKITWHGEPMRYVIVNLEPMEGGAEADGMTDENGIFELRSFANDGRMDGVVPGKYRVSVEEYDGVRAVRKLLPPQGQPTLIPGGELDSDALVQVEEGQTELNIVLP